MASDEAPNDQFKAIMARLREKGVNPPDDAQSAPLPPIMADPAHVFRHAAADRGETFKPSDILARAKPQASGQDAPQIAQHGPVDSPEPKDAAE